MFVRPATWHPRPVTGLVAVVREARPADRDGIWPLARDFATSFAVDRVAFNAALDVLIADGNNLLLVAEQQAVGIVGYLLAHSQLTLFANGPVAWVGPDRRWTIGTVSRSQPRTAVARRVGFRVCSP